MANERLTAQPLQPRPVLNWVFLVELIVCGVLAIFFLFYFNRVFATLVSYGIRAYTWSKYSVYVELQSLQISLLAGRIFFKGLRYHGENETVLIHSGHVTWRYWFRRVKEVEVGNEGANFHKDFTQRKQSGVEKGSSSANPDLPCRLRVKLHGLEWFVYNRSAAYDAIIASISEPDGNSGSSPEGSVGSRERRSMPTPYSQDPEKPTHFDLPDAPVPAPFHNNSSAAQPSYLVDEVNSMEKGPSRAMNSSSSEATKSLSDSVADNKETETPSFALLRALPIQFECDKGAFVLGNERVPCILTAKFNKACGEITAAACQPPDLHKQIISVNLTHPIITIRPNHAYKKPPTPPPEGEESLGDKSAAGLPFSSRQHHPQHEKSRLWHALRAFKIPPFAHADSVSSKLHESSAVDDEPLQKNSDKRWLGLSRYLHESEHDEHHGWKSVEYARLSTIVDCPSITISYHWDVAGLTPHTERTKEPPSANPAPSLQESFPEWGMDITVQGGIINYGPWMDRRRSELQSIFFPQLFKDNKPRQPLKPGETRTSAAFKLFIEFRDQAILRIPTREPSKDWKWASKTEAYNGAPRPTKRRQKKKPGKSESEKPLGGPEIRPFGWLDIKISADSTVSYTMDMAATSQGFKNRLDLDLRQPEVSSSVNHAHLLRGQALKISCDMKVPLKWNGLQQWVFTIDAGNSEIFFLREHVSLFTDLISDWGAGSLPNYFTFIPIIYTFDIRFNHVKFYLYLNDSNIINNPSDFEDNTFMILQGPELECRLTVPMEKYRPEWSEIPFEIDAQNGFIELHTPPWKTQAAFMTPGRIGQVDTLSITARYKFYSRTSSDLTDTLQLDLRGSSPKVDLFGFVVRYFMKVKDNYFGDDIHFKTLEEYQTLRGDGNNPSKGNQSLDRPNSESNGLDVILSVEALDPCITLPATFYAADRGTQITATSLDVELRFTNYYMDFVITISPFSFSPVTALEADGSSPKDKHQTQMFIDGLNIHGHRLFGLPPTEPTYMCNWDIGVGSTTGDCTVDFLGSLLFGIRIFGSGFNDSENALPPGPSEPIYDVTFLRTTIQAVNIFIQLDSEAILLKTDQIQVNFNDWATTRFSSRLDVTIPSLLAASVGLHTDSQQLMEDPHSYHPSAFLETSLNLASLGLRKDHKDFFRLQQQFIRRHDALTGRSPFLRRQVPDSLLVFVADSPRETAITMPVPMLPPPLLEPGITATSTPGSRGSVINGSAGGSTLKYSIPVSSRPSSSSTQIVGVRSPVPSGKNLSKRRMRGTTHCRPAYDTSGSRYQSAKSSRTMSLADMISGRDSQTPVDQTFRSSFLNPLSVPEKLHLDMTNVPEDQPSEQESMTDSKSLLHLDPNQPSIADDDGQHSSVIIEVGSESNVFITPLGITTMIRLLEKLQPSETREILDDIQLDVLSRIMDTVGSDLTTPGTASLCLKIPSAHACFSDSRDGSLPMKYVNQQPKTDRYYIALRGFTLCTRSKLEARRNDSLEQESTLSAVHARVDSLKFTLQGQQGNPGDDNAAICAVVDEAIIWYFNANARSASVQIRGFDIAALTTEIEYLSSIVNHVSNYASHLSSKVSLLQRNKLENMQAVVFKLISNGSAVPDPASLTRPSYVLRSAIDHLRLSDSWKITSRLRQVLQHTATPDVSELIDYLRAHISRNGSTARNQAVRILNEWRSWELADIKKSYLITKVFGPEAKSSHQDSRGLLGKALIRVESLKAVLDPGPRQSQLAIESVLMNCVRSSASTTESTAGPDSPYTTSIEAYTRGISVSLGWQLYKAVETLLKIHRDGKLHDFNTTAKPEPSDASTAHIYHLVFVADDTSVAVQSINFELSSHFDKLQGSFLSLNPIQEQPAITCMSMQLGMWSSEIVSEQRVLADFGLSRLHVWFVQHSSANSRNLSCSLGELSIDIKEDMSSLADTLDLLISEELVFVRDMARLVGLPDQAAGHHAPESESSLIDIAVAVDLHTYILKVALLPWLRYDVLGSSVRCSVRPRSPSRIKFVFDAGEQLHQMLLDTDAGIQELSHLRIPPLTASVSIHQHPEARMCRAQLFVDTVRIEAAMINRLLAAITRPEVTTLIEQTTSTVHSIKARFDEVFPSQDTHPSKPAPKPFLYSGALAIAGIVIHAESRSRENSRKACSIQIDFGSVQVKITNKDDHAGASPTPLRGQAAIERLAIQLSHSDDSSRPQCGQLAFGTYIETSCLKNNLGLQVRVLSMRIESFESRIYTETASALLEIYIHLQSSIKGLDFSKGAQYLRKLRKTKRPGSLAAPKKTAGLPDGSDNVFLDIEVSFRLLKARIIWCADPVVNNPLQDVPQNLVLSFDEASLMARKEKAARLKIGNLQLALMPEDGTQSDSPTNSALLPEIIFRVAYQSTKIGRNLIFQAAGRSLDVRLTTQFILPAMAIASSINRANQMFKAISATRRKSGPVAEDTKEPLQKKKRPISLFVDADFAGAVVHLSGVSEQDGQASRPDMSRGKRGRQGGSQGKSNIWEGSTTVLRSPGVALKLEFRDDALGTSSLDGEIMVHSSSNVLYPSVVPLIKQISSSVRQVMDEAPEAPKEPKSEQKSRTNESIFTGDPGDLLGHCKLNLGLRICEQDFSLSCEPAAELKATTRFEGVYVALNTVPTVDGGQFMTASATLSGFRAAIQHAYSRDSTGKLELSSLILSIMNSKHLNGVNGISAILKINTTEAFINARQIQDYLLFRDIWWQTDVSDSPPVESRSATKGSTAFPVQRYQQATAAAAFPWTATVALAELKVQLDLGRALGKSSFVISDLWLSSRKSSDWEQNLCVGCREMAIRGSGRLSGAVELQGLRIRTSIQWPSREQELYEVPLIQASLGFSQLRVKAAFDFQVFLVAHIDSFQFFMYNVRGKQTTTVDQLVGVLEAGKTQLLCTATCAAQVTAVYQAIVRLVQEKRASYEAALQSFDKSKMRRSLSTQTSQKAATQKSPDQLKAPRSLHTNIVVFVKDASVGVLPSTLSDTQVFKVEMLDTQARFAVVVLTGKTHSRLGLTLGQLRVGVSALRHSRTTDTAQEIDINEALKRVSESRDGTILKVPKVIATMQTWQGIDSMRIDYIFKSSFEGKVDVGWNYSRIGFIRALWSSHTRALSQRLGRPLPESAVKVTGGRQLQASIPEDDDAAGPSAEKPEKITAVVNVPQSKYDYHALEPPVVVTPQLRDMGEATPPLEWIGLHRERLPNLTHQIVMVALLGIAKEVEDAYAKILGNTRHDAASMGV